MLKKSCYNCNNGLVQVVKNLLYCVKCGTIVVEDVTILEDGLITKEQLNEFHEKDAKVVPLINKDVKIMTFLLYIVSILSFLTIVKGCV